MSTAKKLQLVAEFSDLSRAYQAHEELKAAGFSEDRLGMASSSSVAPQAGEDPEHHLEHAADGAGMGTLAGAALGGLAAGSLAGALPGALVGGLVGVFVGMGIPEPEARHYERAYSQGNTLLSVDVGDRQEEVKQILEKHGGTVKGPYALP